MSEPYAAAEAREADRAARRAAQIEFARPVVLEAGAGTGKTTALVARILAWCLGEGWRRAEAEACEAEASAAPERLAPRVLRGVVAITFTEAAAAEMESRVAESLHALASGARPHGLLQEALPEEPAARERAGALLGALDALAVQTIHAFCRRLLADHPLEAGLHPRFEVDAEGTGAQDAVREGLERGWAEGLAGEGDPALLELVRRGTGPAELEEALGELVRAHVDPATLEADPLAPERVRALADRLRAAAESFLAAAGGRLSEVRRARKPAEVEAAVRATAEAATAVVEGTRAELDRLREAVYAAWDRTTLERLRGYAKAELGPSEEEVLAGVAEALAERAGELAPLVRHVAEELDPEGLEAARRVLAPLLARVRAALRERGLVSFDALLAEARELLARRPEVAARERARMRQLLVDEFQDTDPMQCELVAALALEGPEAERPGLFVVGDPKQSIYGFRRADLAAYERFLARALGPEGRPQRLCVNHRSVPAVLEEVERCVRPVMRERRGLQPRFERLVPAADAAAAGGEGPPAVEHWVSRAWSAEEGAPARRTRRPEAAGLEARALARALREAHDEGGVPWREMGVLFRTATGLDPYLDALREAGVPYATLRDRSYYRRREVIDAAALVRCVLDPDDALATVTFLRSPAVGVPDAAWIPLWSRGLPERLRELYGTDAEALAELERLVREAAATVPDGVPRLERIRGWEEGLLAAVQAVGWLRERFEREPADAFVEALRSALLVEAGEAGRYLGAYRLANLERFFRELEAALEEPGRDVPGLLRGLREAVAEGREAEEARPGDEAEDAVPVMTIHGAKGLGFRHVYLLQHDKGSGGAGSRRATEAPHATRGEEACEYRLLGAPTLGFDRVEAARAERERAEDVRTLYVALTRAKERLVLAGVWPSRAAPGRAASHAQLLAARAVPPPDLDAAMRALAEGRGGVPRDAAGVPWRFPALEPDAGAEAPRWPRERSGGALAPRARIEAESRALSEARRRARAREARPMGGAAAAAVGDGDAAGAGRRSGETPRARGAAAEEAARARAVGTAVHRALEHLELELAPREALERALPAAEAALAEAEGADGPAARERVRSLLASTLEGALGERLRALAPSVLARELPVLLPPEPEGREGPEPPEGPVGFVSGAIDLLHRDPETGELVVVDFKTDAVASAEAARERAAGYRPQLALYARALREALGLRDAPRTELWFLAAGERVVLPPGPGGA